MDHARIGPDFRFRSRNWPSAELLLPVAPIFAARVKCRDQPFKYSYNQAFGIIERTNWGERKLSGSSAVRECTVTADRRKVFLYRQCIQRDC